MRSLSGGRLTGRQGRPSLKQSLRIKRRGTLEFLAAIHSVLVHGVSWKQMCPIPRSKGATDSLDTLVEKSDFIVNGMLHFQ